MKTIKGTLIILGILALMTLTPATFADDPESEKAPYYLTSAELERALEVQANLDRPDDYARVLYFHRTPGCSTCQLMSKYVFETIKTRFLIEVKNRTVILSYHNFEDPQNAKLVKTFKIASPTLVIIQGKNGKEVKAKKADRIWSLAGDKMSFMTYVEKEIRNWLPQ